MERISDHPDIREIERTGYPRRHDLRPFTSCDWCGADIHVGDEYYEIHGTVLCFDCVQDCLRKAEVD